MSMADTAVKIRRQALLNGYRGGPASGCFPLMNCIVGCHVVHLARWSGEQSHPVRRKRWRHVPD